MEAKDFVDELVARARKAQEEIREVFTGAG